MNMEQNANIKYIFCTVQDTTQKSFLDPDWKVSYHQKPIPAFS